MNIKVILIYCNYRPLFTIICLFIFRLLADGICQEKNIPSISSINRIIRDKAILQRRSFDGSLKDCDVSCFTNENYFIRERLKTKLREEGKE